jgi:hypothetical protein
MSVISGPVRFDYIRSENRHFFLFSDVHNSSSGMCEGCTFIDTLEELSRIGETFSYFVEMPIIKTRVRHSDTPIITAIRHSDDCMRRRKECLPNIIYNWSDPRSIFPSTILNLSRTDFEIAVGQRRGLEMILIEFLKSYVEGADILADLFVSSIEEFCENFPERFTIAMRILEMRFTSFLKNNPNAIRNVEIKRIGIFIAPLMDLNFISRIEHLNKDGSLPKNIIYYAGGYHIENLILYLNAIGITKHLIYGTENFRAIAPDRIPRCVVTNIPLKEMME